jgi:hypothetical protein
MTPWYQAFSCRGGRRRCGGCAGRRLGAAGGGGVDADAVAAVLHGDGRGQRVDAALGCRIGHAMHAPGGDRGDVHDHALLLLQHGRQHGAAAPQGGEQRAADLRFDLGFLVVLEGLGPDGAADVVDQHIDAAKAGQSLGGHGLGAGEGLQVGLEGVGGASCRHDAGNDLLHQRRAVHRQHPAALGGHLPATPWPIPWAAPVTMTALPLKRSERLML